MGLAMLRAAPLRQALHKARKKKSVFSGFYYLKTGPVFIRFLFQPNKNRGASAASYGYLACLRVHAQVHTGSSRRAKQPLFFYLADTRGADKKKRGTSCAVYTRYGASGSARTAKTRVEATSFWPFI